MSKSKTEYKLFYKKPRFSFLNFLAVSLCFLTIYSAFVAFATLDAEKDSPNRLYLIKEKKRLIMQLLEFERLHGRGMDENVDGYNNIIISSLIETLKNNQTNCIFRCYDKKGSKGTIEII